MRSWMLEDQFAEAIYYIIVPLLTDVYPHLLYYYGPDSMFLRTVLKPEIDTIQCVKSGSKFLSCTLLSNTNNMNIKSGTFIEVPLYEINGIKSRY